jgi:hypothetical protein
VSGSFLAPAIDYSAGILPGTTQQADPDAYGVAGSAGISLGTGTGQHGVEHVQLTGGGGMNPFTAVWHWLNTPFTTPLSPASVAILVGVILVSVIIWNLVLYHIRIAAESI